MPAETAYTPQLGPARPSALPQASPADFGAGVGAAMEQLGGTLHESEVRAYRIERALTADQERANFAKNFSLQRLAWDKARVDGRITAGPGAAGYTKSMEDAYDAAAPSLTEGITDDAVRREAQAQVAGYRDNFVGSAYEYEAISGAKKITTDTVAKFDADRALIRTSDDPTAYKSTTVAGDAYLNTLTGIDDATREGLRRDMHGGNAKAYIERVVDTNPAAARAMIDSGMFTGILDSDQLDGLLGQADVGVRRVQSEQEHKAALEKSELNEQITTTKAQLSAGIDVPDDQLATLSAQAGAVGDTSNAFDLSEARVRNGFNKESRGWTAQQWETERNRLRALPKPTMTEQVRLDQLEKRMPDAVSEFNKDPGAWAAANKVPPPVLDFNNAGTIAARRQWQGTVSRATGRPTPFLSVQEEADYKAQYADSPAGAVDVINHISMIGGRDAVTTMLKIAPDDPKAARLVLLAPSVRGSALAGIKLLDAQPTLLSDKTARLPFDQRLGIAGSLMDGTQLNGAYTVAKGLYLDKMRKSGRLDPNGANFDQGEWNQAIHSALGGTYDGQHWFGGVWSWGGQQVLIPNTITGKQFEGALTRLTSGAVRWDPKAAKGPAWGDRSPMSMTDLKAFAPVMRPDGYYEFHGPNGSIVHTKSGGIFTLDVATIARRQPR